MKSASLKTNLTDAQWEFLKPMLPKRKKLGRPPTDRRQVIDAILYVLKGGIPWRLLPQNFPPWKTVYHVFRKWSLDRTWAALNDALRVCLRRAEGRHEQPTAAILDSQSVKSDGHGGEFGYDAGKRIKGRKRHLLVDTLGLVLGTVVTPADCPEREGAQQVLQRVGDWFTRWRKLWVDGGYTGKAFAQWVGDHRLCGAAAPVDRRAHLRLAYVRHRRLVRDYERTEASAESWIHLVLIRLQLRRLA